MTEKASTRPMSEEELKEVHEFFKERIDKLKEYRIVAKTRLQDVESSLNKDAPARAVFVAAHLTTLYEYICELYEMLDTWVDGFYETDKVVSDNEKELQRHKPVLEYMRQSMEHTQKTLKEQK